MPEQKRKIIQKSMFERVHERIHKRSLKNALKKQTTATTKNVVEVDVVTKRDELESFSDAEGSTKNDFTSQEDGAIEFRLNAFD